MVIKVKAAPMIFLKINNYFIFIKPFSSQQNINQTNSIYSFIYYTIEHNCVSSKIENNYVILFGTPAHIVAFEKLIFGVKKMQQEINFYDLRLQFVV